MYRILVPALIIAAITAATAVDSEAQAVPDWSPPTTEMPQMPAQADAAWMRSVSGWFRGVDRISGLSTSDLRVSTEGSGPGGAALYIRFQSGHFPVVAWSDRSGDGKADLIEVFRNGRAVVQMIDSDYSGRANVLRVYDANGSLARERRL